MSLQEVDEQSKSLLDSQAHIWSQIFSFINSMSLKRAIQLQIPDIINRHGAPMLLSELVDALPINSQKSHFIHRLLRILVHSGLFVKQSVSRRTGGNTDVEEVGEGYLLSPASRLLLTDEPLSMRPFVLSMLDPILMDPWQHMTTWFRNDDDINPLETTYGRSNLFHLAVENQMFNQHFNEAMATDSRLVADVVLKHCKGVFEGLNSVVDVGGGTGTLSKSIAEAFPNINCVCFDLSNVVKGLDGSGNFSYVSGDMFQSIPKADAVLMKWILHDWNDEECINILKRCKEAIASSDNGRKLIIIEMVVMDGEAGNKTLETQLRCDMLMMTLVTGKERTEKEWAKLFSDAHFMNGYKITPLLGLKSLIEVYP